jgi:hypothetical protein
MVVSERPFFATDRTVARINCDCRSCFEAVLFFVGGPTPDLLINFPRHQPHATCTNAELFSSSTDQQYKLFPFSLQ